jgi:hypothetical protein
VLEPPEVLGGGDDLRCADHRPDGHSRVPPPASRGGDAACNGASRCADVVEHDGLWQEDTSNEHEQGNRREHDG